MAFVDKGGYVSKATVAKLFQWYRPIVSVENGRGYTISRVAALIGFP